VNVNDSATATPNTIVVILKNLSINGASTRFDGIRFTSEKTLRRELPHIRLPRQQTNSDGIEINLNGVGLTFAVHVKDTKIENTRATPIRQGITNGTLNCSYDVCGWPEAIGA
jgi:hypothetical protein